MARGEHVASESGRAARRGPSSLRVALLVVGILLLAANLRTSLTGVAPLIGQIRADTGVSNGVAGLLTALPLLAFGVLSPVAPALARRIGIERALLASLFVLAAGILLRSAGSAAALFLGTVVLGAAIAAGNVLLPGLVKQGFPERTGLMTSAYTTTMGIAAALAAGASAPVAIGVGWRASLALWALPILVAIVAWIPLVWGARPSDESAPTSRGVSGPWRSPLAWQVTLFMGLQSLVYYVTLTWLPEILQDEGMGVSRAGWLLALSQASGIATMFLAPMLAGRKPSQRTVVTAAVALNGAGTLGLLVAGDTAAALWVVLLGLGQGACFSLALTFFALRAPDPEHAAALSGMAQSVGYLLAASGPFLFGALRDATGAWTVPLTLLLALTVCLLIAGLGAARDAQIPGSNAPASRSGPRGEA
ncbi:CynX/NimT family MFS transporter [Rubrobacter marinus]|uniref:CynX/NimT family MFS transporter n=1 Tax=Rubrobacter marinus TaxID=2653852 RepID=UPI001D18313E|nr:MFS transporter [Rubrobacter marinus]